MASKKEPILTMPLRQGPRFTPLASAARQPAIRTIDDLRAWFSNAPGETYAREVLIPASGPWVSMLQLPPSLIEVIRLTLPNPQAVTLVFHPWVDAPDRFRQAIRLYAEVESTDFPSVYNSSGRIVIEWGTGAARNWTYVDMAPGSLSIPNAQWVAISGWSYGRTVRLGATAQVGYYHPNANAYWTALRYDKSVVSIIRPVPHYSREVTAYYRAYTLNEEGYIDLYDINLNSQIRFLLRPAISPNPVAIPYPPVSVPLAGGVWQIQAGIGVANPPAAGSVAAICTVRI